MSFVFVLDQQRQPLAPVHPGRARYLLQAGYAAVWRRYPFTLILTGTEARPQAEQEEMAEVEEVPTPLHLKLDPGSKTTGLAII